MKTAQEIVHALLDGFQKGDRVALKRDFWGHRAGTKGRITQRHPPTPVNNYTGKLKLRGSPPASVTDKDENDLFMPRPKASFYPSMGGPSSM